MNLCRNTFSSILESQKGNNNENVRNLRNAEHDAGDGESTEPSGWGGYDM